MTTQTYNIGDLHRSSIDFYALDGTTLTDPTTIAFTLFKPDGSSVSYVYVTDAELVRDSQGKYHVDVSYDQKGRHILKWEATGAVELVEQTETYVLETR